MSKRKLLNKITSNELIYQKLQKLNSNGFFINQSYNFYYIEIIFIINFKSYYNP
jgi:hypothetical protein